MAKAKRVVLVPLAALEVEQARTWYERKRSGLGTEFSVEVDAAIERICQSPEMYAKVRKDYRRVMVKRFPYSIYYEYGSGTVTIYSIFNCSQDPARLDERLP